MPVHSADRRDVAQYARRLLDRCLRLEEIGIGQRASASRISAALRAPGMRSM
jgi:hypothetical protein